MGVFAGLKDWLVANMWTKTECNTVNDIVPVNVVPDRPNLGADIQQMINTREFENTFDTMSPFLLAALGAWPGYWLYRGLDYHTHRAHVPLPMYIRQTFYQAKLVQLVIILVGIFNVVKDQSKTHLMLSNDKDVDKKA